MFDLILSIKPEYVRMIESGEKLAEIRKSEPTRTDINRVWVYRTNEKGIPGAVVGFWEWNGVDCGRADDFTLKYSPKSKHIIEYLGERWSQNAHRYEYGFGYAFPIKNYTKIKPVSFSELFPGKKPSPGFLYVEPVPILSDLYLFYNPHLPINEVRVRDTLNSPFKRTDSVRFTGYLNECKRYIEKYIIRTKPKIRWEKIHEKWTFEEVEPVDLEKVEVK